MMYSTSEEHFEIFKAEARKWLQFFGLSEWEIFFSHAECMGNRAECSSSHSGRIARLTLGLHWDTLEPPDEQRVKKTAFHEVCELLLASYWHMAVVAELSGEQRENLIMSESHAVIRRLENAVFWPARPRE